MRIAAMLVAIAVLAACSTAPNRTAQNPAPVEDRSFESGSSTAAAPASSGQLAGTQIGGGRGQPADVAPGPAGSAYAGEQVVPARPDRPRG